MKLPIKGRLWRPGLYPWVGKIPWRKERNTTPIFWPGEFHSPWGHKESDMTERLWHPTPVLLPGKSHGRRSLVGCSPWGSLRVGHDWATSLSLFTLRHWRRKWQPTPVFLSGESQGRGSPVGCRLWGRTESDMTEVT